MPPPETHGLPGYRRKCRCDICREANARRIRAARAARAARLKADPTLQPHGVTNTYVNWGCRCYACRTNHVGGDVRQKTTREWLMYEPHPNRHHTAVPIGRDWVSETV